MKTIIDDNGVERFLGNNPAPIRMRWTVYGDVPQAPLIAKSAWPDLIAKYPAGPDDPWLTDPHDQDGIGMCNASATCEAIESSRSQMGMETIRLSGGDLYHRICGGSDNGSTLEDGIQAAMSEGVAPVSVCPYLDWRSNKPGAAAERIKYRVVEAYLCPTFDHCMSAVMSGFKLVSGVMWYNNYKVDGEGWLPTRGSGGGGGHAVMGYKPTMRNNVFGIWHQNSWTPQWGLKGRCVFPSTMYSGPVGGWWAVRSTVYTDTGAPPLKPLAV